MKLVIFGATGRTGRHLLEQALQAGHQVTAIVRDPERLPALMAQGLRVFAADVMNPAAIAPAIAGADAVISAIAPPGGRAPSTVGPDSARSIIQAMREGDVRRLVAITGSMVDDTGDGPFFRYLAKPLVRRLLKGTYQDMRQTEDEIHGSELDWTIIRAPYLNDKPASGRYRTAIDHNVPREFSLSRADLAASTLAVIDDATTVRRHVFVAH